MRVWQPGSHLVQAQGKVEDWSWAATKRRLRALYLLARPYKARTALVILSLLGATGVSLVPPFLIGRAVAGAIMLAAVTGPADKIEPRYRHLIAQGADIAAGGNGRLQGGQQQLAP